MTYPKKEPLGRCREALEEFMSDAQPPSGDEREALITALRDNASLSQAEQQRRKAANMLAADADAYAQGRYDEEMRQGPPQSVWDGLAADAPEQEPVAEIVECQVMGQQTVREIDGRWKFLRIGDKLYTAPPAPEGWLAKLKECRSSVKFDRDQYDRLVLRKQRAGALNACDTDELNRLQSLLEFIDKPPDAAPQPPASANAKPLTDTQLAHALISCKDPIAMGRVSSDDWRSFARAIEAAHGIKEQP